MLQLYGNNRQIYLNYIRTSFSRAKLRLRKCSEKPTEESYNGCRGIHQILAAAMETLHFREFDSRFNNESLSVINEELKFIKEEGKILLKLSMG